MPYIHTVLLSDDGKNFTSVQQIENDIPPTHFKDLVFDQKEQKARYVRVKAGTQKGFIFTDEIIIY